MFKKNIYTGNIVTDTEAMTKTKTYHHGNLREALIVAGLEILEDKGLAGLTLRACATRAGASHTAPQNHFENLAGLQTAIAARGYQRLFQRMTENMSPNASQPEKRHCALAGYVAFATSEPGLFELMFSRQRTKSDDPELEEQASRCFAVLSENTSDLVGDQAGQPDAPLKVQIMYWSLVHGFAQLKVSGKLDKDGMKDLTVFDVLPDV